MTVKNIIELKEYKKKIVPKEDLPNELGAFLWRENGNKINVEFPTLKTANNWELTSNGWVGYIPLSQEYGLRLLPRVELKNLLHMLEYAYNLKSFQFIEGIQDCETIEELYERLVKVFVKRVIDRTKRGLYREYIQQNDRLPYVRGKLNVRSMIKQPWKVKLDCVYQDHTNDIEENQIILWTLSKLVMSDSISEGTRNLVRKAYRSLAGTIKVRPFKPSECIKRFYNRLNSDYLPIHVLAKFFLENSGPAVKSGTSKMIPFLVNMPRLFEKFIAEWLKKNLKGYIVRAQEKVNLDKENSLSFNIDLVIYSGLTGEAVAVLDTKYKINERPSDNDISQIASYAMTKNCTKAFLIYPIDMNPPVNVTVGSVAIRCLTFQLSGDLEANGMRMVDELMRFIE
ncbi:hypothetical protein DU53_09745 [Kosmotoga sp. DU53]|uniref:McrBC 5-methylcytosine restriction system component-like protein n=1 Tax=Kosmotoga olearia (strain ATCC BAA-1733 / DSM 21960 / TBF 19.5.1) TaxID=521045 RepID=C5CG01_KOSOT|nr:McrBC 5-methylcytosine restriction system component-like protein [Kosmotoga olearia TBF 19.5.1]MDI3524171.1 5-methylcytosine-specific restriction enzyme subunit McrC [Kosmotoga sp.]MDK2954050.1 5-methylcytosine-specific restriction enzyme subunit McrC [Kosmotoga sp.]OAA19689.1 hypothetical protein DU53_09745 [Kosmotoga sp. DU53]